MFEKLALGFTAGTACIVGFLVVLGLLIALLLPGSPMSRRYAGCSVLMSNSTQAFSARASR